MPKTFNCPSCVAPLAFHDSIMQKCKYCGAEVMAPPEVYENEAFKQKQKIEKVNAIVNNFLSNSEGANVNIIDLSKSSAQGINQNISEILSEVKAGRESDAVQVFKETYHVRGRDAQKVIDSMKAGEGFDLSRFNFELGDSLSEANRNAKRKNKIGWILVFLTILLTIIGIAGVIIMSVLLKA